MIKAVNLTKYYGDKVAVDHISFHVKRGEIFGFLGPNGAGKTTTVRMLSTLTKIDEGEAYVNGFNVKTEKIKVKESIGVVQDVSNLYEELTVEENLYFLAELYRADKRNVERLIREFNLPRKKKFGKLSFGYKRRVAIVAALIHEPPVLFLDEPAVGLDVHSAKIVRDMIVELNKEGKTIFLTTHNMVEAEKLPHRIAIINKGRIVAIGKKDELRKMLGKELRVKLKVKPMERFLRLLGNYQVDEDYIVIKTGDFDSFLEELCTLRRRLNLKVEEIVTELPSIEEVFLKLTGD